jgi:chromosome segregation ATPase
LKELKSRCRGYLGQFYELIKPINSTYDIAVKVAMQRCLRMLVVDSEEAAAICNEFLKEKDMAKDLLVLPNVPDKQYGKGMHAKLQGTQG